MSKQTKVEHQTSQMTRLLSYWATRKKEAGFHFIATLPKEAKRTTEQDEALLSGRKFFLIYTQVGQAIWTKVLLQEQGAGRVYFLEVQEKEEKVNDSEQ